MSTAEREAAAEGVRETTAAIALVPAADDPRLFDTYLRRARALVVLADTGETIRLDLDRAARCLLSQGGSRLLKMEASKLRSRRLDPLHLALCVAEPTLVEAMGAIFGLPLLAFYARTATQDVGTEVRAMSSAFRNGKVESSADVTGVAAATYAGAFGLLATGDKAGARAVLKKMERFLESAPESAAPGPGGVRLLHGCAALAGITARSVPAVQTALCAIAEIGGDVPDLMVHGLIGLAMLETLEVDIRVLPVSGTDAAIAGAVQAAWRAVD